MPTTLTNFRTRVILLPATPLGLLPERWLVEHWCTTCNQRVVGAELASHAASHAAGAVASVSRI